MATPRQIRGISQSAASGKVFVRFAFNPGDVESLASDLSYASTQGVIRSVMQLKKIGNEVVDELKRNFPDKKKSRASVVKSRLGYAAIRQRSLRLKEGWRVRFYDAGIVAARQLLPGASLLGFYIEHRMQGDSRIRTILNSLESGSRAFQIRPVFARALRFPNKRGNDQQFADHAEIPARPGTYYMRKTAEFADRLLASRGSQMEQELVDLIEKGDAVRLRTLSRESIKQDATANIENAQENFESVFNRIGNPLSAARAIKARVKRRR